MVPLLWVEGVVGCVEKLCIIVRCCVFYVWVFLELFKYFCFVDKNLIFHRGVYIKKNRAVRDMNTILGNGCFNKT